MTLPLNLVLVRHGQSEGNDANQRSREGDNSAFTDQFLNQHSQYWKLTQTGKSQAQHAGMWIKRNIEFNFDRFYVSEYDRAMQTAGLLEIKGAQWSPKISLRERDRGEIDVVPDDVLKSKYAMVLEHRKRSAFFWRPPGGESLADVEQRIRSFLVTLDREAAGKNVIVVCHGEVMWVFRFILESMSLERYNDLDNSRDPADKINNCQIIWYRRVDNHEVSDSYLAMTSVNPVYDYSKKGAWHTIKRGKLSNQDLRDRYETEASEAGA